ncbi:MAG: hypothetical protein AB7P14_07725 [Blastocatellales bacterium]
MWRLSLILFAVIFFAAQPAAAQSYEFPVEHEHTLRSCRGKLIITPEKIEYQTEHKDHARVWRYDELQQIKVESPKKLELVSYEDQKWRLGLDRVFKFKLLEGEITAEISALLLERATHPLVTSVLPTGEGAPTFETLVKHLHRFGGCIGTLKIYPDRVVYESKEMPSDSRFWRYSEIQNFSQSERYRFEIVSFEDKFGGPKAYNFQLREALPATAYDYVWARVYPSKLRRDDRLAQPGDSPALLSKRPATEQ